jgi:hypothetical protein
MKKLLLGALLLLSTLSFSQNNLKLNYEKDVMNDKEYIFLSERLLCSEDGKIGFSITPMFKIIGGVISYNSTSVKSVGIGHCMENDEIIFLFEDDTKLVLKSWQKFNCDGKSYFDLRGNELVNLNKRIKAIRLTNGYKYESYTYILKTENEKNYFVYVNQLLVSQKYEIKNK